MTRPPRRAALMLDFQWRYDRIGYGRHEERYVKVICDQQGLPPDWSDVAAVVLIVREREAKVVRTAARNYVTSLRRADASRTTDVVGVCA